MTLKLIDELFMRILNRPATAAEVETCRKDMQAVDDDHRRMAEELGKREMRVCPEAARARAPAPGSHRRGQAALAAYEKEQAPKLAEARAQEGRDDRQARGRPQGVRDDGTRQEDGRLGKGEGAVDRQSLAGSRAQDHRAPPIARPSPRSRMARSSSPAPTRTAS